MAVETEQDRSQGEQTLGRAVAAVVRRSDAMITKTDIHGGIQPILLTRTFSWHVFRCGGARRVRRQLRAQAADAVQGVKAFTTEASELRSCGWWRNSTVDIELSAIQSSPAWVYTAGV
jgi:hypothetical protein